MMRRFGSSKRKDRDYVMRPGAYAILPRGQDLLLTHQASPFNEVQLPGGGIDPGETPIAALHREVFEETGWHIAKPRKLGAFRRFTFMPDYDLWAEKVCHIYTARPVRQISAPPEKGHTAIWADPHTAIKLLYNDGDRHFVRAYLHHLDT